MKISEVAKLTRLNISTIRFYEKSGLCPFIKRGTDGNREFSATDTDWLLLLASLRVTGMPLSDMRAFASLYASGEETVPQRKAALQAHQRSLEDRQSELDQCCIILDEKLQKYEEILEDRQ